MSKVQVSIPAEDRVPFLQKIAFSFGVNIDYTASGMLTGVLWMPYFNIGLGLNPVWLGVILMIIRIWDAISDPLIGNWSDNTRTRWGRRRPYIFAGAVLTAAIYPFLWRVPAGLSQPGMFTYLCLIGIVFFTVFTLWSVPYYGMHMELTPNYDERTRLTAWMAFFSKCAGLIAGWIMAIATGPWFINAATGEPDLVIGIKTCSWFIAGFILIFGICPALFVKERYYKAEAKAQPRERFWTSVKESLHCKPLILLIAASFSLVLGHLCIATLGQYVNIYFVNNGHIDDASVIAGWRTTVATLVGIGCIPLWTWLGEHYDKKNMLLAMLIINMIGHALNYWCLRPDMPYLQIIPGAFDAAAMGAIWLFIPSMKGDVADYDELATHKRREGSINAFFSWFLKVAHTGALGIGGALLAVVGFDAKLLEQPQDVLDRMMHFYLILPIIIWSASIIFVIIYPLTRDRMNDIRTTLEDRRGKI